MRLSDRKIDVLQWIIHDPRQTQRGKFYSHICSKPQTGQKMHIFQQQQSNNVT